MKNPLKKRFLRDLKKEKTKYISIFAFIVLMVGVVSGMLVAGNSMMRTYDDGINDYNMEDGHFELKEKADIKDLEKINDDLDEKVKIYDLAFYNFDFTFNGNSEYAVRIYRNRSEVNTVSLHKGEMPKAVNEIAIDRLFADNNDIEIGDTLRIDNKDMKVVAFIALPDYSCLYEKNSDALFNANTFTIAIVSDETFDSFNSAKYHYGYAYTFDNEIDDRAAFDASNTLLEKLITKYPVTDFVSRQNNKAINFARTDMGKDSMGTLIMLYILIVLLGFIFALLMNSTIEKETKEIGTLRASGYTKTEMVMHYMTVPMVVSLVGFILGNVVGYLGFKDFMMQMYYGSYSLAVFKTYWNPQAFVLTTVVPFIILFAICFISLTLKIQLSPLDFLRGSFKKNGKKGAIKLPNFKFLTRFRMRVLIQNMPNYITMIIGIILADVLFLFGATMLPILEHHTDRVVESKIASFQYALKAPVETKNTNAEKYCVTGLVREKEDSDDLMEIMVYGIADNSKYFTKAEIPANKNEVVVSDQILKLCNLKVGDNLNLREEYGDNSYSFKIAGAFDYPAGTAIFMNIDNYNAAFDMADGYFTGYLSNEELTDIDENYIYTVITEADLTNLSRQMNDSMGAIMPLIKYLSIIIFVIVIYLLAKIVLEKNALAIALSKILGYNRAEIGKIYIVSTGIAVACGILLSIPLALTAIKYMFEVVLLEYDIYAQVYVAPRYIIEMVAFSALAFGIIGLFQLKKINKIPMEKALKNAE